MPEGKENPMLVMVLSSFLSRLFVVVIRHFVICLWVNTAYELCNAHENKYANTHGNQGYRVAMFFMYRL